MPWHAELNLSVLHGVGPDDLTAALSSPARPVLNTPLQVARWRESGQGRPCDVMVDTGMNRLGLTPEEARSGLLEGLQIKTLMSHLACADALEGFPHFDMNARQLADFQAVAAATPAARYSLANSDGIMLGREYCLDLTRPGIAIYGGWPRSGGEGHIRPVVSLEAQIVQLRTVRAGQGVGYGSTFKPCCDLRVAILNIGYADGYLRALAERALAEVDDLKLPILGLISMDLIAVTAPETIALAEGDWMRLSFNLPMMAGQMSQYEMLTTLGSRFERIWT
jgi:alanine racemase